MTEFNSKHTAPYLSTIICVKDGLSWEHHLIKRDSIDHNLWHMLH